MRKKIVAVMSAIVALALSSAALVSYAAPEIPADVTVKTMDTALANPNQWTLKNSAAVSNNELTFPANAGAYANPNLGLKATELVQFKWTPNFEAGGNTQLILRSTMPDNVPDEVKAQADFGYYNLYIDNTGAVYIFYKKVNEIEKRSSVGGSIAGKAAVGQECTVTTGAVDTADGGVRILLYINDDKIIDTVDTAGDSAEFEGAPIKSNQNFSIEVINSTCKVSCVADTPPTPPVTEDPFKDLKVNTINPLLSDANKWSFKFRGGEVADGTLTMTSDEGTAAGEVVATPNCVLSRDQLIKFTYTPGEATFPNGYAVFAFRLGDAALHTGVQFQYYGFLVGEGDGSTQNVWFLYSKEGMAPGGAAVKYSHPVAAAEEHEIVCGSIRTENGIRSLLFIDGEKVVDLEDTETDDKVQGKPLETAYNFNFYTMKDDYTITGAEGTPLDLSAEPDKGVTQPIPDDGGDDDNNDNNSSEPDDTNQPNTSDNSKPDDSSKPDAPAKTGVDFAVLTFVLLIASAAVAVIAKKVKSE